MQLIDLRRLRPTALACAAGVAAIVTPLQLAAADVLHVPAQHPTIQAAIEAANPGDEVVVAPGVYTGEGNKNLSFLGKAITVRSSGGAAGAVETIIDCETSGRAFNFTTGEGPDSILDGFTIANGFGPPRGGGIRVSLASPTIRNCTITNCFGWDMGGAIDLWNSNAHIQNCTFAGNFADFMGGAVSFFTGAGHVTVSECVFTGNHGLGFGGGIYVFGTNNSLTVRNCIFTGNDAAGIYAEYANSVTIANCLFAGNLKTGVRAIGSNVQITNCTITRNASNSEGAGFAATSGGNHSISNSILWNNTTMAGAPALAEITPADSIAVYDSIVEGGWKGPGANVSEEDPLFATGPSGNWTSPRVYDPVSGFTVFTDVNASFTPGSLAGRLLNANTAQLRLLLIHDNTQTTIRVRGNVTAGYSTALFAPAGNEPYQVYNMRPAAQSPAIDTGDNAALPPDITTDLDGNPRIVDGTGDGAAIVDIGAYEFQPGSPSIGDINGDGYVNVDDLLLLLQAWGECPPKAGCPADLAPPPDGDANVDVDDLLVLLANWG